MSSTQCEPASLPRQGAENLIDRRNRANNVCGESISIVNSACSQIPLYHTKERKKFKKQGKGKRKKKENKSTFSLVGG
jgi:hypothetical protein